MFTHANLPRYPKEKIDGILNHWQTDVYDNMLLTLGDSQSNKSWKRPQNWEFKDCKPSARFNAFSGLANVDMLTKWVLIPASETNDHKYNICLYSK